MAVDPALPFEGVSHNINAVMGLTFRSMPRMARIVQMRFIHHLEALRCEGVGQLPFDRVNCSHLVRLQHDPEKCEAVFGQDHAQKRL
jgi:hypothetical protein